MTEPQKSNFVLVPNVRGLLERVVEALIAVLDTIEADPDMEEDGTSEDEGHDEPSLGAGGYWTDAGLQHDLEQDEADKEPSLGRLETIHQGAASYAQGWRTDGEVSGDEGKPEDASLRRGEA